MTAELEKRKVPDIFTFFDGKKVETSEDWEKRKAELRSYFQEEMYGVLPEKPLSVTSEIYYSEDNYCAGKALLKKINLTLHFENKDFTFPITSVIPKKKAKLTFLLINFRDNVPDRYYPTEEIIDSECAGISFNYKDVSSDDNDFTNGLAGVFFENGERNNNGASKITLWAYAAMRVLDYIETVPELDASRTVVIGHSRLGKTALFTGALDSRFYGVISNDSGCCGAAITRGKIGETYKKINDVFPFWFCKNFEKYAESKEEFKTDQNALIALSAPNKVYVASAEEDSWADPYSEFLGIYSASAAYGFYGKKGFSENCEFLNEPFKIHGENCAYRMRAGTHYLGREDWQNYIEYFTEVKK